MSALRQIDLLPAGCQPWNLDVCATSTERFAYCSTLAIYIYEYHAKYNEYKLECIMSEHRKTITTIAWHPFDNDLILSASVDPRICVWNVRTQKLVASFTNLKGAIPASLGWHPTEASTFGFICGRGPLQLLDAEESDGRTRAVEATIFLSDVSHFSWNYKHSRKLAFGHVDGSISILWTQEKIDRHNLKPESEEGATEDDPVISLQWDSLSSDYLLVTNLNHGIRLIDTENMFVIMKFQSPSAVSRVNSVVWVPSGPGMFVSGDAQSGVLRVWNVSRKTPVENIILKKTGFHTIRLVPRIKPPTKSESNSWNSHISSTSVAHDPPSAPNSDSFVLPPADILCTFIDGGVGLYNLDKRKWSFLRQMGHTETIFCCEFQPENCDILATASFDGTVKLWDVTTMDVVNSSSGNEGIIYSLSWSPGNLNCIACGTGKKGIFVWDVTHSRVVSRYLEHGSSPVYSVAWNRKDSQLLASTCGGGLCIVRNIDGKLVQKYKHPRAVYGCDWSPNNRDMIATSCEDKCIRIFYIAAGTDQPLRTFKGHTAKAFHVRWSPLREGFLCSGSDDTTVRIWDYSEDDCAGVLEGHTGPVRGLLWNPEIPYILLSGSWDYSIKVWDTRTLSCLETVFNHGADVYGLACHPHRPFMVASTSRDSTVRLWSMATLAHPISLSILAQRPSDEIFAKNIDDALKSENVPLLAGQHSKEIQFSGLFKESSPFISLYKNTSQLFSTPRGTRNLWDLIAVLSGEDMTLLSRSYSKGIIHIKHLLQIKYSEAQELETVKMSGFSGSRKKNDKLKAAANIHVKIGHMQRYCELMVEMGEWDKALSFAPGVSLDYWKSLMERRANQLVNEGNDIAIPYCLAIGNVQKLCEFYKERGEFQEAVLVSLATKDLSMNNRKSNDCKRFDLKRNDVKENRVNEVPHERQNKLLMESSSLLADWYFENSQPVIAACCHLAVNDISSALRKLLRGNELELAFTVARVLDVQGELLQIPVCYLSKRCEKLGRWNLSVDLLNIVDGCQDELWMLCARCPSPTAVIENVHRMAGIPSLSECFQKAEELLAEQKYHEALKYYLISTTPEISLDIGLNLIRDIMLKEYWNLKNVCDILKLLSCVRTEKLQSSKMSRQKHELIVLSAYIGALVAIQRKYKPIVMLLFNHARFLINKEKVNLPVTGVQIENESKAWLYHDIEQENSKDTEELKRTWSNMNRRIGVCKSDLECGTDIVAGSHLPQNSNTKPSILTGEQIKGPVFILEDGESVMSLNNAIMWAKVNPFSPLATGERINPF
ncbi:WD repeat-containing protein 17-like [Dendronephthya gigantea]|uniref:WD repeat-containing protein 17-like n=1 Tax=Dendronephthya gigantea TaxID=151771 RepID=UPI00106C2700|nr:WD repeat-containing protein 17-like [Dendronephthya gigantea]